MDLGWLDVCLRVADVRQSRAFYEELGFRRVEGEDGEGWAVVVNGEARIGLYEARHMGDQAFNLNFRGGNVVDIAKGLAEAGHRFEKPLSVSESGGASVTARDPDGHILFFDSSPSEVKKL
jgi:catechol 2,3-dioxygenase-like lactoylglutathione lyase family enzyme